MAGHLHGDSCREITQQRASITQSAWHRHLVDVHGRRPVSLQRLAPQRKKLVAIWRGRFWSEAVAHDVFGNDARDNEV